MIDLNKTAFNIKRSIIEMLNPLESHHIGCSLSIVDILVYLYFQELNVDPKNPKSENRDIFILSKGHAGAALYAILAEKGFFDKKTLLKYDTEGGILPEHSTAIVPGIEVSTGSLGHGLPIGCGFALSFKNDNKENKVVVLISDGELDEGSNWEAIMFANSHDLSNLTVIVDCNKFQGYGKTKDIIDLSPLSDKLKSFGWNYFEINGHSFEDLKKTFKEIKKNKNNKPNFILANTIKGKGIKEFEGKFESHHKSITKEEKINILKSMK